MVVMIQLPSARTSLMSSTTDAGNSRRRRQRRSQPPSRCSYQLIAGDEFRSLDACSMSPRRTELNAERLSAAFSESLVLAAQGDIQRLKSIAVAERIDLNGANRRGWRLIQIAAEAGHLHIVMWLLDAGVDGDARDALGWSPLMLAASRDCVAIVHALLQRGWHRSAVDAVRVAAANNSIRSLQVLLSRLHIKNGQCDRGQCPVRLAAGRQYYGVVQALLVAGYSPRCLGKIIKEYELGVVVKLALGARRVLKRGLKGIIVSALIDDRGPMRISIHPMWSGIEVRLRRKRNMFFRKRARPILAHIGYDEQIRLLTHDGLVLGQMTVKLDATRAYSSQQLIVALRQRQLAWSESYPIVTETNELVHILKSEVPNLIAARSANQAALNRISTVLPEASTIALNNAVKLARQRLEIDENLQQIRCRLVRNIQLATDIATILEVGQRLIESGNDFANDAFVNGKKNRVQRELDKVYVCRTQLNDLFGSLIGLVSDRDRNTTPSNELQRTISLTADGMCQRCGGANASIAFESCRHLGLCHSCSQNRSRLRARCRICHSRVNMIVSKSVQSTI